MKIDTEPIKAAPTAHAQTGINGMKNILEDALYEMGYDNTLVDTLIERNVIDFNHVDYTSHVINQLIDHYGEVVLCGGLEEAVTFEDLDVSLIGELGRSWRTSKGNTFRKRIQSIITEPIERLGMKTITRCELEDNRGFSEELESVKQYLAIDSGKFNAYLPDVDIVIYSPENSRVIAIISCGVNLKNRAIDMAYWRLKLQVDPKTAAIKFYLITADIGRDSENCKLPKKGASHCGNGP